MYMCFGLANMLSPLCCDLISADLMGECGPNSPDGESGTQFTNKNKRIHITKGIPHRLSVGSRLLLPCKMSVSLPLIHPRGRSAVTFTALLLFSCLCLLLITRPTPCIAIRKLTKEQLDKIEDQWMEDEVEDDDDAPFKYRRTSEGHRLPPEPTGPKTEMGFVTLKQSNKKLTDTLAGRWGDQLLAGGVHTRAYTIEDNRILFACERGYRDMSRVREFVLKQAETVEFEWNNKKTTPADLANLSDEDDTDASSQTDPLAKFHAMQEEQLMAKRRAEKKAKQKNKKKKLSGKRKTKTSTKGKTKRKEAATKTRQKSKQDEKRQNKEQGGSATKQQPQQTSDLKSEL